MISHKHKFIFISPPKTGSTSLLKILLSHASFEKIIDQPQWNTFDFYEKPYDFKQGSWNDFTDKINSSDPRKHANLGSYATEYLYKYQTFCVIRNPFSRILSMWKWEKKVKGFFEGVDYKKLKFKEFLQNHTWDWYFKPQYDFIQTDFVDTNCVQLIRFENIQEDFNDMLKKTGIPQQTLPHKNKTKHKHYTEYYDDETREIVAEKYAKDIEYFGYEFGE